MRRDGEARDGGAIYVKSHDRLVPIDGEVQERGAMYGQCDIAEELTTEIRR